ncbi:MAG: hypothetical protein AB7G76_05805 [Steroidobacteraceae bacterium]
MRLSRYTAGALAALAITPGATIAHDDDAHSENGHARHRPARLSIEAPDTGYFNGLTTTSGWSLVLRIEAPHAVAIVETPEEPTRPVGRREAIVLTDPDGCIDMRHFPIARAGQPYEDCDGPDETFLEFTSERFDTFDLDDAQTGHFQVREQLVDDAFVHGALLDKPYLRTTNGAVAEVPRPQTGGSRLDGFGYGPDDDLPGLVVMANVGAARVFDEDFDRALGPHIRNMAGFVNTVSQELRTRRGGPALLASMHVVGGMFEPLALFDLDVDAPGVDFLRRIDSGPVESFNFLAPPQKDDDILRELLSTYGPYRLEVRAVIVEGVAPTIIRDVNGDGRHTARDLERMGFTLQSNEASLRLAVDFDVLLTETVTGRTCPPPSLLYRDLDGNGRDGAISCSGSGGAGRVRRVPR